MTKRKPNKKRRKQLAGRKALSQAYEQKLLVDDSHLVFEKFLEEKSHDYDKLVFDMRKYDDQVAEFSALLTERDKLKWIEKNIKVI